jgi:hypothetical protein
MIEPSDVNVIYIYWPVVWTDDGLLDPLDLANCVSLLDGPSYTCKNIIAISRGMPYLD